MENENWGEDIISLMDEEGNQSEYKIVACAEMDGTEYMALEPIIEDPEEALMDAAEPGIPEGERGAWMRTARPIWMPFWMRMSWTVWPRSSGIS